MRGTLLPLGRGGDPQAWSLKAGSQPALHFLLVPEDHLGRTSEGWQEPESFVSAPKTG